MYIKLHYGCILDSFIHIVLLNHLIYFSFCSSIQVTFKQRQEEGKVFEHSNIWAYSNKFPISNEIDNVQEKHYLPRLT
jgi:hypothetical protein